MAADGMNEESLILLEVSQAISRHINCLSDPNRVIRKQGLEGIRKEVYRRKEPLNAVNLAILFKEYQGQVIKLFSDPIEKCRELSIIIVEEYIKRTGNVNDAVRTNLIPMIVQRLGQLEIVEPSEELRLQLIQNLTVVVTHSAQQNALYLDDYIRILQRTLVDPFPEVRKESCSCASILAKSIPAQFHTQSESLIRPLLQSISHQHSRVRVAVVNAIGQVLLYGNNKNVDDVVSHLAQRLFDQAPSVREAVTKVAGCWLLDLPDRYSFWHKLMPLLLTNLTDELPAIQEEAISLWDDVGIRYMRENENDLKEKEDFAAADPIHYPSGVERPNLGCRQLMYLNQSKILPGLSRDILDWVVDTRKKSAALLYTVIINAEQAITQHMQLLLETIYKAAIDDEQEVVSYVEKSAQMLGYFVRPDTWVPLLIPTVEKHQHFGSLLALCNLIRGSEKTAVENHLPMICSAVSHPDICTTRQLNIQLKILDFVDAVLALYAIGVHEPIAISFDLFKIVISVISVAADEIIISRANASLIELASTQSMEYQQLFKTHALQLLESFGDSYLYWNSSSVERLIFDTLLMYSGPVVGDILDKVMPMFKANMSPDKDPEVRLKLFSLVLRLVGNAPKTVNSSDKFGGFSVYITRDMVLPNCVWKAGRTAAAIRTTAVSCLWSLLKNGMFPKDQLLLVIEEILSQLLSLMEDDVLDTRLIAIRTLMHLFSVAGSSFEQHRLHQIYPNLLKRLDDSNDSARIAASKTFESYLRCFGNSYEPKLYKAHLEDIIKGLLVHLDDPNSDIQDAIQDVLKVVATIEASTLIKETERVQHKHRTPRYCNAIIRYATSFGQTNDTGPN